MAKNLNILTNAANRIENGPRVIDRRKLPRCIHPGCRRKVNAMPSPSDLTQFHCYLHATDDESAHYYAAWDRYLDGAKVPVEEDPR